MLHVLDNRVSTLILRAHRTRRDHLWSAQVGDDELNAAPGSLAGPRRQSFNLYLWQ